jgi:hypothetical protein
VRSVEEGSSSAIVEWAIVRNASARKGERGKEVMGEIAGVSVRRLRSRGYSASLLARAHESER